MADTCLLSPPAGANRQALEAHLEMLWALNTDDPLVQLAIEDTERLLAAIPSV